MICYTIYDGYAVERVFRGNYTTTEGCIRRLLEARPGVRLIAAPDKIKSTTLYDACCELTHLAEDVEDKTWFVGINLLAVKAVASLSLISSTHNWRVLQSYEIFTEWAKDKVR